MLPALPVEAISAREADMAGATKGTLPAGKTPARTTKARPAAGKSRRKAPAAKSPAAKSAADKPAAAAELPVREGEDRWTAAELTEVRAGLQEQIEGLRAEIAASASQIAEGDGSDGAGDDQADAGAKTYEREHELSLAYNSQDLLAQIERAVQRMDAGTYGTCESCAKPIGKARLQVFPRATLCVTCKQREERR
ncbi:TraR/DksA C4-type zinc finger protein [Actinomadura sp. BRA 177]|nr:TraR/DksA C4-type zinc finger protein [Actinomadura sp. BRA 177]